MLDHRATYEVDVANDRALAIAGLNPWEYEVPYEIDRVDGYPIYEEHDLDQCEADAELVAAWISVEPGDLRYPEAWAY